MRPQKKYYIATYSAVRDRSNPDTWFYSFNTTTFLPCTDDYTLSVNLASWSSRGGWKDNAFQKTIAKPCTTVRSFFPREWRKAMVYVFNDPDRKCPFPPGTYTATNVSTQNDFTFPPSFFYGKFRGTGRVFTLAKELVGCVRFYFSIVPKHP
ncbi:uncharacterized protein LOC117643461 [Thrips palmi]|uniref:Uncharacterized protein LOC117643461 n=1 Tax=Thrips palmi TaxID=161013 RepID=A0A6P8YMB2_THRPL|nr:uncharacterized protein LOC117643461 [Thrips palmi]